MEKEQDWGDVYGKLVKDQLKKNSNDLKATLEGKQKAKKDVEQKPYGKVYRGFWGGMQDHGGYNAGDFGSGDWGGGGDGGGDGGGGGE